VFRTTSAAFIRKKQGQAQSWLLTEVQWRAIATHYTAAVKSAFNWHGAARRNPKSLQGLFLAGRFSNEDSQHPLPNGHPIMIAKTFADAFSRFGGESSNTLHIYDDGYVLSIACSSDRHLAIRKILLEEWQTIDEARSSDGFLSVFVIRGISDGPHHPIMVATTDGYKDHRQDDHNTIDIAAEWFERGSRIKCGD